MWLSHTYMYASFMLCAYMYIQMYKFLKLPIPEEEQEVVDFGEKLLKFGVSITQYRKAYAMEDITM